MSHSLRKSILTIAAGGALAALPLLGGCDYLDTATGKASRDVDQQVQDAGLLNVEGQAPAALTILQKAADNTSANPASRSHALAMLAEHQRQAAQQLIDAVNANQTDLSRLFLETTGLVQQLNRINQSIAAQQALEPTQARADIKAKIAAATGSPDKPTWFNNPTAPIPTLNKVKQDISKLDGQITQLQDQIKALTSQRATLLTQAETANSQSDSQTGQQSVDLYKTGSDLRKQAAVVSTHIDEASAALVALQQLRSIAVEQQTVVTDAIKGLQQQLTDVEANWKKIQQQIDNQANQAKALAEGTSADDSASQSQRVSSSVAGKFDVIDDLNAADAAKLADATKLLTSASSHFEEAAKIANSLQSELTRKMRDPANAKSVEQAAWKQLSSALMPMEYQLRQAAVEQALASLHVQQMQGLQAQISLADEIRAPYDALGLKVPASLSAKSDLESRYNAAFEAASQAYTKADTLLSTVAQSPSAAHIKNAASTAQILTQYGQYQMEQLAGHAPQAAEHLRQAKQLVGDAISANIALPTLPGALAAAQSVPSNQPDQAPEQ